jgi:putative heme-binding domain-containing protein
MKRVCLLVVIGTSSVARAADPPPKLIAAWAAGPLETRITFDRDAPKALAEALVGTRIVSGDDVKSGDRYDPGHPSSPDVPARGSLRIAAARVEGRTLILATDPHSRDTTYAVWLPAPVNAGVTYRLRGVEFVWGEEGEASKPLAAGVWPSLDSSRFAGESRPVGNPRRLVLRTLVSLPKGKVTLTARASVPFTLDLGSESAKSAETQGERTATVATEVEADVTDLTWTLEASGPLTFSAAFRTAGELTERTLSPEQLILPWAPPAALNSAPLPVPEAILKGGDPAKGALVFKSEGAKCATCHKVRDEGGDVGPDLTDLVRRDRAWVYRQLNEPSAVIHPDYVPYTVLTKDGRVLAGIVRAEGGDAIKVTNTEAKSTVIAKADIEELKPSATSIMPVGLLGALGEEGVRDLVAFLTTPPPPKR